jgi:hypothetical protein
MSFEKALGDELITTSSDLKEVTDNGILEKVFPIYAPEGTIAPFIIFVSSEGVQDKSFQGYLTSKEVDCEIYIVHNSYSGMKALTKEVLAKILSFQGRAIGDNGPFIQDVTYEKPIEKYENEVKLYRSAFDMKVRF